VTFSFETFARRGGLEGPHKDGWGVAFHDGRDAVVVREQEPASDSPYARFLRRHGQPSPIVFSHIRRATHGDLRLANTQPFSRELGGRRHVFAHNGHVPDVKGDPRFAFRHYAPIGTTDSERCFCTLLERMRELWMETTSAQDASPPPLEDRLAIVEDLAAAMREHGPANFLYTDGDAVFVHAHRRTQDSGAIEPPGLHLLERHCRVDRDALDGVDVGFQGPAQEQCLVLVASRPLSDEAWLPLEEGTVLVLRDGQRVV
jgi:glutamine amidotransferase